jgi:hypothetical protein
MKVEGLFYGLTPAMSLFRAAAMREEESAR